jgi:hypothetical protein
MSLKDPFPWVSAVVTVAAVIFALWVLLSWFRGFLRWWLL